MAKPRGSSRFPLVFRIFSIAFAPEKPCVLGLAWIFASGTPFAPAWGLRSGLLNEISGLQSSCRLQKACRAGFAGNNLAAFGMGAAEQTPRFRRNGENAPETVCFGGAGTRFADSRAAFESRSVGRTCVFGFPAKPPQKPCQTGGGCICSGGAGGKIARGFLLFLRFGIHLFDLVFVEFVDDFALQFHGGSQFARFLGE